VAALLEIFARVLLPALLLVAVGALVGRWQRLDLTTLAKLNLYCFVPAFLLVRVAESGFGWGEIGRITVVVLAPLFLLALPVFLALRAARVGAQLAAPLTVAGLVSNAGNFGVPVAHLAFGRAGAEVQALPVLLMNTSIFFFGYIALSARARGLRGALAGYFKMPMFYAIAAGFLLRETGLVQPAPSPVISWLWKAARLATDGTVPIALVTLGAQMVARLRWPRWRLLAPVAAVKLLLVPLVTFALAGWLGLLPWPGAQLVLAAGAPAAVNTLLLVVELEGEAEAVADVVFWTTLLSALTITPLLLALRVAYGSALPAP
jgi:malate permease and related proteins